MYAKLERKDWSCDIKQEKYATDSNGWSCIGNKSNQLILFRALRKRTKIRIVYRFRCTRLFFYFQHLIYYAQILMNASKSEWINNTENKCVTVDGIFVKLAVIKHFQWCALKRKIRPTECLYLTSYSQFNVILSINQRHSR